jgi:hypothetical protein
MAKTKERTDKQVGGKHPGGRAGERTDRNGAGPVGDPEQLVELYRQMVLVRTFETACQRSFRKGKIGGYLHLYTGEEAVAAGFLSAFRRGDRVITGYRDHAHALLLGCEPGAVMAELYGRRDGLVRGKGGSMHLFAVDRGLWGASIVGGHIPWAWASPTRCATRNRPHLSALPGGRGVQGGPSTGGQPGRAVGRGRPVRGGVITRATNCDGAPRAAGDRDDRPRGQVRRLRHRSEGRRYGLEAVLDCAERITPGPGEQ